MCMCVLLALETSSQHKKSFDPALGHSKGVSFLGLLNFVRRCLVFPRQLRLWDDHLHDKHRAEQSTSTSTSTERQ